MEQNHRKPHSAVKYSSIAALPSQDAYECGNMKDAIGYSECLANDWTLINCWLYTYWKYKKWTGDVVLITIINN